MILSRRSTLRALALAALLAGPAAAQVTPFPEDRVERAKAFFMKNAAAADHMDCITTLNHAVRTCYLEDPFLELGSQIDRTFAALTAKGFATAPRVIEFFDERGRPTVGVTAPYTLRESAFDALVSMAGGVRGWHVFGLSIMDGYHSVTLNLDLRDPSAPRVHWSDQWSSKGGWKEYDKAGLDEALTNHTRSWWSDTKKPRSRATLWRLLPTTRSRVAVSTGAVNLRAGPSPTAEIVGKTAPGVRYRVLGREGNWLQVERQDGSTAWVSAAVVRTMRATMPPRPPIVVADAAPVTDAPPVTDAAPVTGLVSAVPGQ